MENSEKNLIKEIPSSLKQLARLVVRGFYNTEDAFIIDMLVRNPCMKEDDICDLLKFERKMLRSRIATLMKDRFIQIRVKMETGIDGKSQRQNYYFINYKVFVNVVKYKLDHMRRRMETEERDATNRASFKCLICYKTYTDLEADQLFDPVTEEFRCTFCKALVEEDESALPKQDSRLLLARFNEQMEALYILLREVEDIKLAPEILEPEPTDVSSLINADKAIKKLEIWSGEATRNQNLLEQTAILVNLGEEVKNPTIIKEKPIWMSESTIGDFTDASLDTVSPHAISDHNEMDKKHVPSSDNIISVLLALENKQQNVSIRPQVETSPLNEAGSEVMESDEENSAPLVQVGNKKIPINEIDTTIIEEMTSEEKDAYIYLYQEYYDNEFD